jgi:diguanylate cyclase (GGDEF)-like protein
MSKFEGNFVALTPKMVNALHRLMRMSRGQIPPDAEELEDRFGKFGYRDDTSFQPKLSAAIEKFNRASVLFLDLDNFKSVNDEHGHKTGDDVIREALRAVERVVGSQGELFHRSGDEMIVLLPNLNKSVAQAVAESIRVTIEQTDFPVVGQGRITTTIGLASFQDTCDSWEDLLTFADQAAMRAKKSAKNRVADNLE